MSEILCEACGEDCGLRGVDERGRCASCFAFGWVDVDEDEGSARAEFITSKPCTCHIDEDACDAHVEWVLTPMAEMMAELQIQVAQEAERQRGLFYHNWDRRWM